MIGACAVSGAALLANLYTCGRVLAALVMSPRARLARATKKPAHAHAPTLALRPEVQALTHVVRTMLHLFYL